MFVQHGVGFDSLCAKNDCAMIQPDAVWHEKQNRRQVALPAALNSLGFSSER